MTLDLTCTIDPISALRTDDDTIGFQVKNAAGAPVSIAGASLTFRVLPNEYSPVSAALITKSSPASGITVVNESTGLVDIAVSASEKAIAGVGSFFYRIMLVEANGTDTAVGAGPFTISG